MWFYAITGLINALTNTILGLFVYFKNKKAEINKTFGLFCLSIAVWSYAYFIWQISTTKDLALFWSRALMVGAIFIPVTYFHFITAFLNIYQKKKKLVILGYVFSFIFLILNFTSLFVKNVEPELSFPFWPKPGIAFHPFLLMFFGYVVYSWYLMFRALRKTTGIEKTQIKYVLLGTLLAFSGGSTNYFLWYGIPIPPLGNGLVIFGIIAIVYAILKHHLMNIRVIATELFTGLIIITLLIYTIFSPSLNEFLIRGSVFLIVIIFGIFLIRGTLKEFENLEKLVFREKVLREKAEGLAKEKERLAEQFQVVAIRSVAFKNTAEELAAREKRLRQEVEKLLKIKEYFYMMASHHLLTPQSQILGLTSLALEGNYGEIPPKIRKVLKDISNANAKAIRLANQILIVNQFDLGKIEPDFKEVKAEELIEPLLKEFEKKAKEKNLYWTFEKPKEISLKAFVDLEDIQIALRNILENAIIYTQKGGIKISAKGGENFLLITVKDTGAGIEKEELPILFEGFAKGKAGFLYWMQGAGLGLYISKKYIEINKGKIWAESEGKGKGSTFYIELPLFTSK